MRAILKLLVRQRWSFATRAVATAAIIAAAGLVRLFAPLQAAPFVIYTPLIFLLTLAFDWAAGTFAVVLSDAIAAWFFMVDNGRWTLDGTQLLGIGQYALVGGGMVAICASLRRAIVETEEARQALKRSRTQMQDARDEAEAAREAADRARDAAEAANRAKSAFLANMSHELRTPLSAVIGYSEMLEEEAAEGGQTELLPDLGKIKSNARHLLGLINDVLDLSKVEANKMEMFAEEFEIEPFVRDAGATIASLVSRKSNTLTIDVDGAPGSMRTDQIKLRQCLFNLLSNAAKFTENGTISLTVQRRREDGEDWVHFAVRDTGIGMTPDQLTLLFQRFAQADSSTTRKFGGTGLGLALSRAFAQLLGGDIAVESEAGVGTCFTLSLPATYVARGPEAPVALEVLRGEPVLADTAQRELVLVIDDEDQQRHLMTRFLHRQGFAVRTAGDGITGLELARTLLPRVILLDVMMPGRDGWSVLNALKEDPATAGIPVVMVSFVAEPGMSRALGAADAVAKPVDWNRLKTILAQFHDEPGEVLVVDDDVDMRERLRHALERGGWRVSEAGNGVEALARVATPPLPILILLDLTMPVMDGFSFLHRLREVPGCAHIPVVVLSARDVTGAERAELAGAERVLRKGDVSLHDLAAEIGNIAPH